MSYVSCSLSSGKETLIHFPSYEILNFSKREHTRDCTSGRRQKPWWHEQKFCQPPSSSSAVLLPTIVKLNEPPWCRNCKGIFERTSTCSDNRQANTDINTTICFLNLRIAKPPITAVTVARNNCFRISRTNILV